MRWLQLVATVLVVAAPLPTWALEGEREVSVALVAGPAEASEPTSGVAGGIDGQVLWHTSDFWAFGLAGRSRAWSSPWNAGGALAAEAMARWTLDALQWIPSLGLSAGYQVEAPIGRRGPSARIEASLAYRQQRERAWVFRVQHETTKDSTRVLLAVGLIWYSGKGTTLEL